MLSSETCQITCNVCNSYYLTGTLVSALIVDVVTSHLTRITCNACAHSP